MVRNIMRIMADRPHTDGHIYRRHILDIQKEEHVLIPARTQKNIKGLKASLLYSPLNVY